jgi:hypothetical protein
MESSHCGKTIYRDDWKAISLVSAKGRNLEVINVILQATSVRSFLLTIDSNLDLETWFHPSADFTAIKSIRQTSRTLGNILGAIQSSSGGTETNL